MQRVWITDGSLVPFTDVVQLHATHRGPFGLRAPYKGLVDPAVPVGSATIQGALAGDALYAEAEWCLSFPGGLRRFLERPDSVDLATPVVLQGLIEGKWLNRLLTTDEWSPATMGNNLLADGPGIPTTLGAIEAGAVGTVTISYRYAAHGQTLTRRQQTTLADLRGQDILGLVRDVLRLCEETGQVLDAIDLSAMGESAAIVNERERMRAAMQMGALPLPNPLSFVAPRYRLVVARRLARAVLAEGLGVPPGAPISITTHDGAGTSVGVGTLTWLPPDVRDGDEPAGPAPAGSAR